MKYSSILMITGVMGLLNWGCGADSGSTDNSNAFGGSAPAAGGGAGMGTQPTNVGGGAPTAGGGFSVGGAVGAGGAIGAGGAVGAGGAIGAGGGATVAGGATSAVGSTAKGGATSAGGSTAKGGATSVGGTTGTGGTSGTGGATTTSTVAKFSFFVASQVAMVRLSGSANGFGGDLRYGQANGLAGADKICSDIAEYSMPGAGAKGWRAFLSVTAGPSGTAVNAIDRVGPGPWYDRVGRLVAPDKASLVNTRPAGGSTVIVNDLPNEDGVPNHVASGTAVDNHDTLTGSNTSGQIGNNTYASTCNDWTSVTATGKPTIGHSWPRSTSSGLHWISDHTAPGCAAGINTGSQNGVGSCVGCSGGYGGIYCFALTP